MALVSLQFDNVKVSLGETRLQLHRILLFSSLMAWPSTLKSSRGIQGYSVYICHWVMPRQRGLTSKWKSLTLKGLHTRQVLLLMFFKVGFPPPFPLWCTGTEPFILSKGHSNSQRILSWITFRLWFNFLHREPYFVTHGALVSWRPACKLHRKIPGTRVYISPDLPISKQILNDGISDKDPGWKGREGEG